MLFALLLVHSGLNKIFNYVPVPDDLPIEVVKDNAAMIEIAWLMPLVALAELIGGLFLLIPKARALGVLIVFPVMVGVLLMHIVVEPNGVWMALLIWLILIWLIIDHWPNFKAILFPPTGS